MQYCSGSDSSDGLANRVFPGKDQLAVLCREKEWAETPLGPISSWSTSLRAVAALVVASPMPLVVLWGPELVQIYNDSIRQMMGKKHPTGLGQPNHECWPEVWHFNAPIYEALVTRREPFSFHNERLVIERHGQPEAAYFTLNYSPVTDDDGSVGGVFVTVSETTVAVERAQNEVAQAESKERLKIAVEAADLGTWDLDLTTDTAAIRSLRHDQIFGYEVHQTEWGQEIAMRHVLPEDRPIFQEAFASAMQTGELSCEVRVRWPDGSIHWIAPLGRTYFDSEGRPVRMAGVIADVTERNSAEALRKSEERFRLMADAVPQIVWITDNEGQIEFFNQQWSKYTGMTFHANTATEVFAGEVHPDDIAITLERFEQARRSGSMFFVEHRLRSATGEYRWFLVRAEPYRALSSGEICRWFGASVDIHDRKLAEEKLKESDRRKDEFLAMLAHELRNPLAPIGAAAQLLQMGKLDDGRVRHTSRIIGRQVDHMTHLINDLLDVSRVTRNLVELVKAPLDIRHIVNDAVEQVTPLMQSRRHHLALYLAPDTTMVMGDKKRLVQVIANILNNAAKYTNEGGHITLKTETDKSEVLVEVTDNGIGMTSNLTAHAFDLFAQGERTSDRVDGGLGLGLALVKSLVELHGGHVSCSSEGLGRGSKFKVCLPRIIVSGNHDEALHADGAMQPGTKALRILVVDDNVDAAAMLAMLLEEAGHQVLVEHEPCQALRRSKLEKPDVCLLDIGLPEMDGNELAQHLRAQPETAKAVLIAVTGYGQDGDRKRTLAAGFDHHLVKPLDTKKLAMILAETGV
ncbi:MAG: hypothetical protein NVSMB6_12980 [Burkholderiaceae bacterium]